MLFGGALFASFPKFYATSFGGAYWVWMLILFTFVLQAVSYEFRRKSLNLYGSRVYELFLFINGSVGIFLMLEIPSLNELSDRFLRRTGSVGRPGLGHDNPGKPGRHDALHRLSLTPRLNGERRRGNLANWAAPNLD